MKIQRPVLRPLLLASALAALLSTTSARAASATWNGTTDAVWATTTNWSVSPVPGTGDTATFNNAGGAVDTISLGAGVTVSTILFDTASAAAYTIGSGAVGSQTLRLNNSGAVTMNATVAQNQLFNAAIGLGTDATAGTYTFTNNSAANTLTFAGGITGGTGGTAGAKTLNLAGAGAISLGGIIGNGGATSLALTKSGNGTLTLSGINTFTGATTLSLGTLRATTSASALGAGTLSLGGGTLQLANGTGLAFNRNTTVTATSTVTSDTLAAGAGVTHTLGTLSIGAQTLNITKGANATGTTAGITFGAVTQTGASVFDVATDTTLTLGALQTTAQNITKQGAGTMVLGTAANAARVAGNNILTAGTLRLGSVSALGTTGATLALNGGTLDLATDATVNAYNTTVGGATTINSNRATAGAGITHTLGTLSIGAQTLNIARGANATSGTGAVTFGATTMTGNATFAPAANAQLNLGAVGGNFTLTHNGAGITALTAAGTYNGATTVSGGGTLRVSNATALGSNATVTVNQGVASGGQGTTLDLRGTLTFGSGKTVTFNSNTTGDLRSTLLNGADNNTWAGNIIAAGTGLVQVNAAAGTLTITGDVTSSGGGGTGTLFSRGTGTVIYNGVINLGADRVHNKTDTGTVIINSTGNSWVSTRVANGQLQIGANNALANAPFSFGEGNTNNGRLELNGFNQVVTALNTFATSTGTNHIIRNSNLTTASTLTFATPNATTDTLTNVQVQGTASGLGTLHMVGNGLGRTEFNGGLVSANSWTVNSGTLAFTGTNNRVLPGSVTGLAAGTIEKAGASTLTATSTWNNAGTTNVTGGTLVLRAGTAGAVNVSDGATLTTGLGGGVLTSSAVTFGTAGATTYVPLLTTAGAVAPLSATALTTSGTTVTVTPQAGAFTTGTYRLLDYTGSIGGNGFGGFALSGVGTYPHITAALDNTTAGQVNLVVSAVDSLIWAGQTSSAWDVNNTLNFALASSPTTGAAFYQGDAVAFGDTHDVGAPATPVANSTITGGAVTIGNLTFNNSLVTYSVANNLSGAGGITKTGTGAVTLSGINSYAGVTSVSNGTLTLSGANVLGGGAVTVTGGTLKIGNSDALRGAGSITVSGGGTFDANGTAVGTRYPEIVFSGAGVGGNGAIVNNGAGITNNSHFAKYTMAGDATWGGSGRYDIINNQIFNGGAFTLTKTGAGELWYDAAAGSTLENVIVNGGFFGVQSNNPLSTTATVTVNSGGTHQFFGGFSGQHKVVLNDGGILRTVTGGGSNTLTGQVTLNGSDANRFIQSAGSTTLNIAGKITGTGGFTISDSGTVQLQNATNDYAGDTVINAGTLNFSATGVIPTTTNLIIHGGTFATGNIARTVGSLSGTGGTISGGNTLTSNQSTPTVWNGSLSGTTAQMSGSGSLTLGGTGDNSSGIAIVNSGTLIFAKGNTAAVAQTIHSVGGGAGVTINGGTLQLGGTYDNTTTPGTGVNLAPVGINTATYVDQIYNLVGVVLNAGTFDLNGRQEAINTLTNPAGAGGTVVNTSATAAKLYIGHQNGASTFGGAIQDGAGTVAIEKIGTGTLTLTGASNFSGGLTQTAGAVTVNTGATLGNSPITVTANTFTFDGTHGTGAIALNGTSSFFGAGTSGGTLTAASGTTVRVGTASGGTVATTLTLGGLTLAGGTNLNLDFNTAGTIVDKIATTATNGLSISGVNPLNVVLSGAGWVAGTYPILTYAGAVQGVGASNATLVLSTPVGHSTVNVVDDTAGNVSLQVTGAANKWVGGNGNAWDTNTTLNWNAGDQLFLTGDTVVFDDSATTFTPNIAANQTPAGVTFDNTTAYTLTSTGAFGIVGTGGLIKKNTGTATLSSANTYTGTTDVQQGTLIANFNTGTAQTVFAAASIINVAANATFKAVANDSNFTLANNLTGSGLVVIDPHLTAAAAVRDVTISGNNAGFTGTLRLSPTVIGDGSGTFRTNTISVANAGGATIDVDAGGQAWLNAATFPNNFILTGYGYAEGSGGTPVAASGLTPYSGATKGGIGAIRMNGGVVISGNVTLDGSAKIMAYNATGTISGSIFITNPTDILSVGGANVGSTLILTGTNNVGANALNQIVVNAGGSAGTNILAIGANGTTGTLGTGSVTLNGDGAIGAIRFDRADGYTLAAANTITSSGTNTANTRLYIDTQGAGFLQTGVAVNLGGGALEFGTQAGRTGATGSFDGNVTVGAINVGTAATGAVMNILPGANIVSSGTFHLGQAANISGTVSQTGGDVSVGSHVRVSHFSTNTSAYNISAGTLTIANINTATDPSGGGEQTGGIYLGVDGTGTMAHSGGTVTTDWIVLDNRGDTPAGTNMPDGIDRYTLSGSGLLVLRSQWGITQRNATTAVSLAGGTIRNGGVNLQVRLDTAPDISGAVTLDTVSAGNSFNWLRDATGVGSLALSGGGTLKFTTATTQSIAVPISGAGVVEKLGTGNTTVSGNLSHTGGISVGTGAGNFVLQGTNTFTGPTTVNGGYVVFDSLTADNADSAVILNGGNLALGAMFAGQTATIGSLSGNSATSSINPNYGATTGIKTLSINQTVDGEYAGKIEAGTGSRDMAITKTGSAVLTLSGASTFTGPITVNGGLIAFASSPATSGPLGNSTIVNLNGGGIRYTASGSNALNRSLAIGGGNGILDVGNMAGTLTMAGADVSSSGGNLVKTGLGTALISGTTSLSGAGVVVNGGTLQAGFGTGGTSAINVGATGNLSLQNSVIQALTLGNTAGALTLAGGAKLGFEFDGTTNDSIAIGATGTPNLTAGVITLDLFNFGAGITGGNTYNLLTSTLGDLTLGGLTSYVIGAAPGGFNYSLSATSNVISLGVVTFSPAYWTNSQGTGSWSTLNAGPLSNFSTLATGGVNTAALPGANETVFFSENGVAGPTVTSTLDGNFTIYGLHFVAGSGTVTSVNINQGTSGTLTVQPSTGAGGIDVGTNAGNVVIGAPLVASSTNSPSQTWNVDGTGANGSSLTLNGVVTFNANVIKTGAGTLTLGNAGNTGAGNFTLGGGTLSISATGNMPTGVLTLGNGTTIHNAGTGTITLSNSAYNWNGNFTHSGQSLDQGSGAVTLGAPVQTTVDTSTLTVGGAIGDGANTYGLTKAGGGTLALGGTSTYNGPTVINAGTLSLTGSLTGGGAISTSGSAILSQTPTGVISGASTFTQGSSATSVLAGDNAHTGLTSVTAGVLTLSGNNSAATGGVTLTAGQLNINSDNALGTGRLTLSGGTFDNTDALAHTPAGNPVQTWSNNASVTFTGTRALNLGTGAVTLGTDATAGSFTLTNNSTLPGTSLTIGGPISAVAGGTAGVKTLTIAGPGSTALTGSLTRGSASALDVTVTSGGTTTLSGPASSIRILNINGGASSIVDLGAGNLTITNGGTTGFLSSLGGTINATGGGKIILGSDLLDNGTANGTTLTVNAGITGPFTFEIYGGANSTGVTVLTAQNTFTGRVEINGGNLSVSNIGNTGSMTSNLGQGTIIQSGAAGLSGNTVTTGKLIYTGAGETTNRILTMSGAGFAIEQAALSGHLVFSAPVSVTNTGAKTLFLLGSQAGTAELAGAVPNNTAATSLTKLGTGTWTLSGANTYTGPTTVGAGTLNITNRTAASGAINVGVTSGGAAVLGLGAGNNFSMGAGFMVGTTGGSGTVHHTAGSITFSGGDQLLVGNGTGTGIYNLSGGTLTTLVGGTRGVMLGVNTDTGGTFNLSGTGSLQMTTGGNSILQIGRSDSVANNTTNLFNQTGGSANVGILAMGGAAGGSTGVSSTLALTGGTFSANSFTLLAAGGTNTAVINIGGSAQVALPVFPTNAKGAGSTATITFDSTTGFLSPLTASATYLPAGTFNNAYLTANGAKFNVATGSDITIGQVLRDAVSPAAAGTLTKQGLGVLTLTGPNTYTGATTINGGTLAIGSGGVIANTATNAININNSGTLSMGRTDTWGSSATGVPLNPITIAAGGVMTTSGNFFNTLGAVNLNGGTLTSTGGANANFGSWALRGTVTTGGIVASTISQSGSNANINLGAGSVTGTTFNVADATGDVNTDLTVSALLQNGKNVGNASQASSLTKTGNGTLTLTGANTYTGNTLVSEGTLLVNGSQNPAAGLITVSSGATLGGSGTMGDVKIENGGDLVGTGTMRNVEIMAGGTLAPGDSAGRITTTGDLLLDDTSDLTFELKLDEPWTGGIPTTSDYVAVGNHVPLAGNLTLNGKLTVTALTAFTTPNDGDKWLLMTYGGSLTDGGLDVVSAPGGKTYVIDTISTTGSVFLVAVPEAGTAGLLALGLLLLRRLRRR